MMNLVINLAIIGAFVIVYSILIYACHKWLGRPSTIVGVVPILILAMLLLTSCGSASDHTAENWILLIALMLCWLKG